MTDDDAEVTPAQITIEVCVDSHDAAVIAEAAGADRVELNSALKLDGLSPSPGLFLRVRQAVSLPIISMARPSDNGFCYSEDEWESLVADALWAMDHGADGIAFGVLDPDGRVNQDRCVQLRKLIRGQLVFHKAFDEVASAEEALETLVQCGVDRIMTSGQAKTALMGADLIAQLVRQAAGRIELLPAGKVNSENCGEVVRRTGATQLHGSFAGQLSEVAGEDKPAQLKAEIQAVIARF